MRNITGALVLWVAIGCQPEKPIDSTAVRREMQSREITHATEGQIVGQAMRAGEEIRAQLAPAWRARLAAGLAQAAPADTLGACRLEMLPEYQDLLQRYGATVRRAAENPLNPAHALTDLERTLHDAYRYAQAAGQESPPNVQKAGPQREQLLYTAPIVYAAACGACHGAAADAATRQALRQRSYQPSDEAVATDSLAGIWSVTMSQANAIRLIDAQ